ncbi:MAG: 2-amino-4-hydroxy-6-hydroxymethyldihydropteridine diphosphokinase [Bacteroidota bacterium]
MHTAFLLLGSNLGDRHAHLLNARTWLAGIGVIKGVSGIYSTAPWGLQDQQDFLNQAVILCTSLEPEVLLQKLKEMEKTIGRTTTQRWGPREIDADILVMDELIHRSDILTIPHPRLSERRFALVPLAEIAPNLQVPGTGTDVKTLLNNCNDPLTVSPANC